MLFSPLSISFINVIYSRYLWKTTRLFSLRNYRGTIYDGDNYGNRWMTNLFLSLIHKRIIRTFLRVKSKTRDSNHGLILFNCSDSILRSKSASLKFYYTIRDNKSRGPYHRHSFFFESRSDVQTDTNNLHPIYMQAALVASLCI